MLNPILTAKAVIKTVANNSDEFPPEALSMILRALDQVDREWKMHEDMERFKEQLFFECNDLQGQINKLKEK